MMATFVILFNAVILIWSSRYVDNDFLRVSAYVLAVIFIVSVIQSLYSRYGKK
jgi:hypothetical protein